MLAAFFLIFQIQYSRGYEIPNYSGTLSYRAQRKTPIDVHSSYNLPLTTPFNTILITQWNKYCHNTKDNWWIPNTPEHASVRSSTWTECLLKCENLIAGILFTHLMPHGAIIFPYYIDKCYINASFYMCAHIVDGHLRLCEECDESLCINGHRKLGNISFTWCCVILDRWIDAFYLGSCNEYIT